MNEQAIAEFENELGVRLPDDYRSFLLENSDSLLEKALLFNDPRSGCVDELLTIQQIQENSRNGVIGIPEQSLLHIGGNLMGGYLYLKVSDNGFGEVHYSENYTIKENFLSFSEFMSSTHDEESNKNIERTS